MRALFTVIVACTAVSGCVPDPGRAERVDAAFLRIVAAEDARPAGGRGLSTLVDGTRSEIAFLRHASVRALGRLERPELLDDIAPLLHDPSPLVRRSAANAAAQAFHPSDDARPAAELLLRRVATETDPVVRGTLARSLGRLTLDRSLWREVADVLVDISRDGEDDAPEETLVGVALGLESLVRRHPSEGVSARIAARLGELAQYRTGLASDQDPRRIRTLAVDALGRARRLDMQSVFNAIRDDEWQVGVAAVRYLGVVPPGQRAEALRRVMGHRSPQVVIEGFRHLQGEPRTPLHCRYLLLGAAPPERDVPSVPTTAQLLAIDALAQPCPELAAQGEMLRSIAGSLADATRPWQPASHALVSLARLFPAEASDLLPVHVGHESPFVRTYAARAAAALGDGSVLRSLSEDPHPNVRTAAITGLFELAAHEIDPLLVEQLGADDPQLLMTAADLLVDTPEPDLVAGHAVDAFVRISAAERETWRDPRRALLRLIRGVGDVGLASALEPYLADYDAAVAEDVAAILSEWRGRIRVAAPRPLPRAPIPTPGELRAMDGAHVLLHMAGGGTIDIELHPYVATTNAWRFYRLVREGYFDGLTFHRMVPNFVIQGGSPGANEYQGAAAYTRDEVGLPPHWRGTVGISTRGRDTGDAQVFVNLVDNVRLDHAYTIVGTVVDGMQVVDAVLEGAVIELAEVVDPR